MGYDLWAVTPNGFYSLNNLIQTHLDGGVTMLPKLAMPVSQEVRFPLDRVWYHKREVLVFFMAKFVSWLTRNIGTFW